MESSVRLANKSKLDPIKEGPPVKKRGRGAPSKIEKDAKALADAEKIAADRERDAKILVPYVKPLFAWPFEVMADKRGDHWRLTDENQDKLSYAGLVVLLKYLPGFMIQFKEEIMLLVVAGTIIATRVAEDKKLAASRSAKLRGDGDSGVGKDDPREEAGRNPLAG